MINCGDCIINCGDYEISRWALHDPGPLAHSEFVLVRSLIRPNCIN